MTTRNLEPQPLPRPSDRYEWEPGFDQTSVRKHNLEIAERVKHWGALRTQVAFFRCPWPISIRQYEAIRKKAVARWLGQMEKDGWTLMSKVSVYPNKRRTATGTSGDFYSIALLDEVEIPVAAFFRLNNMKLERVEVPVTDSGE